MFWSTPILIKAPVAVAELLIPEERPPTLSSTYLLLVSESSRVGALVVLGQDAKNSTGLELVIFIVVPVILILLSDEIVRPLAPILSNLLKSVLSR